VQLQADLLDVGENARTNDGVKYLLTVVDAFSKKAWAKPLINKTGPEVARALREVVASSGYEKLQTDKGREFLNSHVRSVLDDEGIDAFTTENDDIKAAIVERFNRTLKKKIYRLLTYRRDGRYIDDLDDMIDAYNKTPGRGTGVAPKKITRRNAEEVYNRLYEDHPRKPTTQRLKPGDHVRMSVHRATFQRGFTANWSREIFVVSRVLDWTKPIVYEIKDLADEPVKGTFYAHELQRVDAPKEFLVEEVRRTRGRRPRRELYVKWLGYPESFNSWIPETNVTTR
jgi:hypothetical protein